MKKHRSSPQNRKFGLKINGNQDALLTPTDNVMYKRNLAALSENYPEYIEPLNNTELNVKYRAVLAGNEQKFNVFSVDRNIYYYDKNDPDQDLKLQFDFLKLRNTRIAVFLGFGLGYEVTYFSKHLVSSQRTEYILIIEKDLELFKTAITYIDYSPMIRDKRIRLILGINEEELLPVMEDYFRKNNKMVNLLKCIKPVYHESSMKLHQQYYINILKRLRESVVYMLEFFGNDPHDSLIGVENMLDNIGEIVRNPGINLLYHKFNGKPAIIAATGPSLNKNKHLLKGLEDKALILCPDASLRILLDIGVKPHLVTSLERIPETAELMKGFSGEDVQEVYYAGTPVIPNTAYEVYPGPRIIVYRNFDHFKWLEIDRGIQDIKHSSGNMAFKLAQALGCDPIILVGQDLAYSRDGRTHASGTKFGEVQQHNVKMERIEVMGNDGQPISTNHFWNLFRRAYEVDIASYQGTCINSSEGGALINGTVVMSLAEAIEKHIEHKFFPLEVIKERISVFSTDNVKSDIEKVLSKIDKTSEDLKLMMEHCLTGIEHIKKEEELFKGVLDGNSPDEKVLQEALSQAFEPRTKVINTQPTMQLFLMHIVQSFNIAFEIDINALRDKYDENAKINSDIALRHLKWYAVMHDIMKICLASLQKARVKVTAVKDEILQGQVHNNVL